jgi:glycosyltransferase involved in cell wall biosynthesis
MPLVSVVMPVLDNATTVTDAVRSVLCQTMPDFEVVVLDNGCNDDTIERVDRLADPRVRIVTHTRTMTFEDCQNEGVRLAESPYVARLDADDRALPDRLALQAAALDADRGLGLIAGGAVKVDEHHNQVAFLAPPAGHAAIWYTLLFGNCIVHSSVMVRREVFTGAGGFRSGYPLAEDHDLWLRLARETRLGAIPRSIVEYHWHGDNASSRNRRTQNASSAAARHAAIAALIGDYSTGLADRISTRAVRSGPDLYDAAALVRRIRTAIRRDCRRRLVPTRGLEARAASLMWMAGGSTRPAWMLIASARFPSVGAGLVAARLAATARRIGGAHRDASARADG